MFDMTSDAPSRYSNPFSTCWTRELDYVECQLSVEDILNDWEANNRWGAIVGPHGTGKTALLLALKRRLSAHGWNCQWIEVSPNNVSTILKQIKKLQNDRTVFMLEGFERLSFAKQSWLLTQLRIRQCRVLATLHAESSTLPWSLKTLANTEVSLDLVRVLFNQLMENNCQQLVFSSDALKCWEHGNGNLRDLWFQLYELHESRCIPLTMPDEQPNSRVRIVAG